MSDIPLFVQKAQAEAISILPEYAYVIPSKQLLIADFIKAKLPSQASALISQTGTSSFSKDMPNTDLACLAMRPLPTKIWINSLEKAIGQAWVDGMQSNP